MASPQSVASHYAAASKGRLIRCTVLGSTPNRAAILRTLSPVSLRAFQSGRDARRRVARQCFRCSVSLPSSSVRSSRNALTRASAGRTRRTPGAAGSFRAAQALGGGCAGFPRGRDRHPQDRAAGGHRERDRGQDRFGDASRLWCGSAWFMKAGRPDVWSPDHSDAAASDWRARRQTRERAVLCRCDR